MKFNKYFDHTNLKPEATKDDIRTLCEEAKKYDFASVCVNGIYTAFAKAEIQQQHMSFRK